MARFGSDRLELRAATSASAADALADADGFVDTRDMVELRGDRYYFVGRETASSTSAASRFIPRKSRLLSIAIRVCRCRWSAARKSPITGALVVADVVVKSDSPAGIADDGNQQLKSDILESLSPHAGPIQSADPDPLRAVARGRTLRKVGAALMQTVIVTGGSRGLGLGIARKLVAAGYQVIAIARRESEQLACAMRPKEPGHKVLSTSKHSTLKTLPAFPLWSKSYARNSARSTDSSTTPDSGPAVSWPPCTTRKSSGWCG